MNSSIKCKSHSDQDIVFLDLSVKTQTSSRLFCLECVESVQNLKLDVVCQMKNLQKKTQEYENEKQKEIGKEYEPSIQKFQNIASNLQQLKEKSIQIYDELIRQAEAVLRNLKQEQSTEMEKYQNLAKNLTLEKLNELAVILSENKGRTSKLQQIKDKFTEFHAQFANHLENLYSYYQEKVKQSNEILFGIPILRSQKAYNNVCSALAFNEKNNIIAGGIAKNVIIWEQLENQLIEQYILTGHSDDVISIIIYESGEIIASGGGSADKTIKLWKFYNLKWNCFQTLYQHSDRITDLQIMKKYNYLISSSADKSIKIWRNENFSDQFSCIQTIQEHTDSVYWISIGYDFMVSSSAEKYFCIFKINVQQEKQQYCIYQKIEAAGIIRRIFFTSCQQILCQQEYPYKLLVYEQNNQNKFQKIQEINLLQPDHNYVLFPVFQIGQKIFLKNNEFLYIIDRSKGGQYYIQFVLNGQFVSGSIGQGKNCLILSNNLNNQLELHDFN